MLSHRLEIIICLQDLRRRSRDPADSLIYAGHNAVQFHIFQRFADRKDQLHQRDPGISLFTGDQGQVSTPFHISTQEGQLRQPGFKVRTFGIILQNADLCSDP